MTKATDIIDYLTYFDKDILSSFQEAVGDWNINKVASLEIGGENCLAFCKYKDFEEKCKNLKNSVVLIKSTPILTLPIISDNLYFPVDDPRYRFAELIIFFNIRELYVNKEDFKETSYREVLKKSKLVSKTAKIYNAEVGDDCSFHHNALIGVDDFCPIQSPDGKSRLMFPQLGYVKIGDRVDIFGNSLVGRGALCITQIGDDTKVDALCQIGHNCKIGKRCMITAGVVIAGSTTLGDDVFIGIGSTIRNGLHIGNNVTIAQGSNVVKDIPDNAIVMGNPAKIVGYNNTDHNPTMVP